jgi:chromosome segregation ATPase
LGTELAGLKNSKEAIEAEQNQILADVEALQSDVDQLNELTDELQTLKDLKDSLQENVGTLENEFGAVTELLEQFNLRADSINEEIAGFSDRWQALENEIQILKILDLIESSREMLSEGEISQAQEKILEARQLINDLRGQVDEYQVEVLSDIADRLQEVLDAIRDAPNSALNLLEKAWQMLLSGLSEEENN